MGIGLGLTFLVAEPGNIVSPSVKSHNHLKENVFLLCMGDWTMLIPVKIYTDVGFSI